MHAEEKSLFANELASRAYIKNRKTVHMTLIVGVLLANS